MKFSRMLVLTTCVLLSAEMPILGCVSPAQEQIAKGDSFLKQDQWTEAIAAYNKAIELDPKLNLAELNMKRATAYSKRGLVYNNSGDYDNAIVDYTKAKELDPKLSDDLNLKLARTYCSLGANHNGKGEYDKAIAEYTLALELEPKYAGAYNLRETTYANKAIADCTKAIELDARDIRSYFNRGLAYEKKYEYDEAFAGYSKVIELDSKYAIAYSLRGKLYDRKGIYDKAMADYNEALELDLTIADANANRRIILNRMKKEEEAAGFWAGLFSATGAKRPNIVDEIAKYSREIEIDSNNALAYWYRGLANYEIGEVIKSDNDRLKARQLGYYWTQP